MKIRAPDNMPLPYVEVDEDTAESGPPYYKLDVAELLERRVVVNVDGKALVDASVWELLLRRDLSGLDRGRELLRVELSLMKGG